jgi:hypothetical protein
MTPSGVLRFARYAYPPNALGYCGAQESQELLEYVDSATIDGGLLQLARSFDGAWPYLQVIAAAGGIDDPLDARVVEAYWIGNDLLEAVPATLLGSSLDERFRKRAGMDFSRLAEPLGESARASHAFHVFGVYPWVGLMRGGVGGERPLHVLDRCRVRWGTVLQRDGATAVVRSNPLEWDGTTLRLGPPRPETVTVAVDGRGLAGDVTPGDTVSLHWDWACERLSDTAVVALRQETQRQLAAVNGPAPAWSAALS